MVHRILFVCLGNICRSPAAEGVFRNMADNMGLSFTVDSAGTSQAHIGDPPYGPMQDAALARGYDLSDLSAREFLATDFDKFDLIVGMDDQNIKDIEALRPDPCSTQVAKLTDYSTSDVSEVPDPYYTRNFDEALDIIEDAAKELLIKVLH